MNTLFEWPNGKRAALSFTFDDARPSQAENGLPILDSFDIKATFYVSFRNLEARLGDWQKAVATGHEIGNHSLHHPCSGNYAFARSKALEEYSLTQMEEELDGASARIEELLGVRARTFAYPCGQSFVGRGRQVQSYVPLVAERFVAGRGFRETGSNDPAFCDLAQLYGLDADTPNETEVLDYIEGALQNGSWLVLVMHEVGGGRQSISTQALEALCRYARKNEKVLWTASVAEIADHINQSREA